MSFRPSNPTRWGVVLMGGCRALSEEDWEVLVRSESLCRTGESGPNWES